LYASEDAACPTLYRANGVLRSGGNRSWKKRRFSRSLHRMIDLHEYFLLKTAPALPLGVLTLVKLSGVVRMKLLKRADA
jgi:hypothetical protein